MTYLDLAIIYLACGAPLSMHYFFGLRGKPTANFIFRSILITLFWPIGVISLIVSALHGRSKGLLDPLSSGTDDQLEAIRIEIECLAFRNGNASAVFEFREVFARYAGLSQAVKTNDFETGVSEVFRLSSDGNGQLATRCLNRKMASRLSSHLARSRGDFVAMIASLSMKDSSAIADLAIQAADLFDDLLTRKMLEMLPAKSTRSGITKIQNVGLKVVERAHLL